MKISVRIWSVGVLVALLAGGASGLAAGGPPGETSPTRAMGHAVSNLVPQTTTNATSGFQAGYAIISSVNTVSDVKATWNVPKLAAKCPSTVQLSAFWIGMDAFNLTASEQIGTETDCYGTTTHYYAWYSFGTAGSTTIPLKVSPGNPMHAEVKYTSSTGKFTLSIHDAKTGKSFSITKGYPKAKRLSAEWIVEAPWRGSGNPLTDFGWVVFNNVSVTISGGTGTITSFTNERITMWSTAHAAVIAVPLWPSHGGATFRVNWKSAGP